MYLEVHAQVQIHQNLDYLNCDTQAHCYSLIGSQHLD